jgi:hypothetical protein
MNDAKCLKKVLEKRFKEVEVHSSPEQLIDFQGKATHYLDESGDKAEIIIRRKHVGGAANDIGFTKDSSGNYKAIISAYDSSKHNQKWLDNLCKDYLVEKATSIMTEEGAELSESETLSNGSIRMKFTVTA